MLLPENVPFANHHIQELGKVYDDLTSIMSSYDDGVVVGLTRDDIAADRNRVNNAIRALHRYRVCFQGEVETKNRLAEKALDCRLNHK